MRSRWGNTLSPGLRIDHYDGVGVKKTQAEPRVGISYLIGPSSTVLRAGYARTMETPYNENLLVATSPDSAALVAAFSEEGGAPEMKRQTVATTKVSCGDLGAALDGKTRIFTAEFSVGV